MRQTTKVLLALLIALVPGGVRGDTKGAIAAAGFSGMLMTFGCGFLRADPPERGDEYDRRGFLLGVSARHSVDQSTGAGTDLDGPEFDIDDGFGLGGRAGYRCNPHVAVEGEVEWFPDLDTELSTRGGGKLEDARIRPLVVTSNVKGYLLTGRVQPYLLAGLGLVSADTKGTSGGKSETDYAARFGGGLDFFVTEHWVVGARGSYLLPLANVPDVEYISIGLGIEYRF